MYFRRGTQGAPPAPRTQEAVAPLPTPPPPGILCAPSSYSIHARSCNVLRCARGTMQNDSFIPVFFSYDKKKLSIYQHRVSKYCDIGIQRILLPYVRKIPFELKISGLGHSSSYLHITEIRNGSKGNHVSPLKDDPSVIIFHGIIIYKKYLRRMKSFTVWVI